MLINRPHSAAMSVLCTITVFLSQSGINSWPGDTLHKFGALDFQKIREICKNYAQNESSKPDPMHVSPDPAGQLWDLTRLQRA
jgi:hypothetical protein